MDLWQGLPAPLCKRAQTGAAWLAAQKEAGRTVTVVHHIDADGVTSGAVALACLRRAGIAHRSVVAKSLDDVHVAAIQDGAHEALWFCDFGSTAYMHFDVPKMVCDHHELVRDGTEESFAHINPLLDDLPGDSISGAGCAMLVALAYDPENADMIVTALVGATGDLQDRSGGFSGANGALLQFAQEKKLARVERDLAWFGPETRDLRKFVAYAEPAIASITGNRRDAEAFLVNLGIDVKKSWSALTGGEKTTVRSALVERALDVGMSAQQIDELWRDVVTVPGEPVGQPVRELREFATLLNSTARYDRTDVGLAVAAGDRDQAYKEALELLQGHRKHLVGALDAFAKRGIKETAALQWIHLEDDVRDTVVGIVCGMALDGLSLRKDKPLLGFAYTPDGRTKVSSRAPAALAGRIDLAVALRAAAAAFDGQGGGHKGAAGATIARGKEQEFLALVDATVAKQLGISAAVSYGQQTL